jgi:hypothetical protein
MKKLFIHILLLSFLLTGFNVHQGFSQKTRFSGDYPVATPDNSPSETQPELEMTMKALAGACKLADDPNTLTKREDPEAYIRDDYKKGCEKLIAYATEILSKSKSSEAKAQLDNLKKLAKLVKSNKFADGLNQLIGEKVDTKAEIESIYYLWTDYLYEKEKDVPWLKPLNLRSSRNFRTMLHYVSSSFDRPFGAQAQSGGVVADAAQALSNCMEAPSELAWQGDSKITMKKEDELRRLASDVAYFEWRMHDKVNGRRAYAIDRDAVIKVKQALYDVVTAMTREQKDWHTDPHHGENLQVLYDLTFENEWRVDGTNALKKIDKKEKTDIDKGLPTRRLY